MPTDPEDVARRLLEVTLGRSPTLGAARLLCIDGLAGSGKSTIAREVGELAPEALVVGTDAMLEGWRGLPGLARTVGELLAPLAEGRPGRWPRWSWVRDDWAGTVEVAPCALLVLEGVGCWARSHRHLVTTLAFVEAPREERLRRWLERDGEAQRRYWADWLSDEDAVHAREGTRAAADVVVAT